MRTSTPTENTQTQAPIPPKKPKSSDPYQTPLPAMNKEEQENRNEQEQEQETEIQTDNKPLEMDLDETIHTTLPNLHVVGQAKKTYIVADGELGIYLIDQHAAHERIVYDRIVKQKSENSVPSQPLLESVTTELDHNQDALLHEILKDLSKHGFILEPFGGTTWIIRAVPHVLNNSNQHPETMILRVLDNLDNNEPVEEPMQKIAATIACHGSVRAGQALGHQHMQELIDQLIKTPEPHTCPHGRPTIIRLDVNRIEREFKRRR